MAWLFHLDQVQNWAYMDNVFTPEECDRIKKIALSKNKEEGSIIGKDNKNIQVDTLRKNSLVWLTEQDQDLIWMYEKLAQATISLNNQFFKFDLYGFTEALQFTEYNAPNDFYIQHIDKLLYGNSRKLSIVVQLTNPDEYEGGELQFNTGGNELEVAHRTQGTLIAFPSYVVHAVSPVTKGVRHSLVGWTSGPDFK